MVRAKARRTHRKRPPRRASRHVPPREPLRAELGTTDRRPVTRLEIDLVREAFQRGGLPFLHGLESIFREREVYEVEGLLRLSAGVLHALAARGFSRVDHWEVQPGGWLPLPEPAHERLVEPVGHLLNALSSDAWKRIASARAFSMRLSGAGELRADVTVRRVHRERSHAISIELVGPITPRELDSVERELRETLSIALVRRRSSAAR